LKENEGITVDMLLNAYNDLSKKMASDRFKAFAAHLRKHDLTLNQYSILSYIERSNACLSIQLAQYLNIKPASITYLVDSLEKRGLVKRIENPGDGRSNLINLTDEGHVVVSYFIDQTITTKFFEEMDQDDREILYLMAKIINKKIFPKSNSTDQLDD
jgi:DNA-binding MarR family transcriptional regulator